MIIIKIGCVFLFVEMSRSQRVERLEKKIRKKVQKILGGYQ